MLVVVVLALIVVGALVAVRVPENPIGWLLLTTGATWSLLAFTEAYARQGIAVSPGSLPGVTLALWFATWLWIPGIAWLPIVALPLVPDGRLLPGRWRILFRSGIAGLALTVLAQSTVRWGERGYSYAFAPDAVNPLHVPALEPVRVGIAVLGGVLLATGAVGALVSAVVRFRRSVGDERLQMKWIVFGVTAALLLWGSSVAVLVVLERLGVHYPHRIEGFFIGLMLGSFPVTVAIAVLKHRLYDLDRIISRTVAYSAVVTILAAVYGFLVVGSQAVLSPVTSGSEFTVAGSTLAVAALFGPLRRRVRAVVDERFDRAHHDARATIDLFTQRLRDQIDLEALADEIEVVATATLHPRVVSLWLCCGGPSTAVTVPERPVGTIVADDRRRR